MKYLKSLARPISPFSDLSEIRASLVFHLFISPCAAIRPISKMLPALLKPAGFLILLLFLQQPIMAQRYWVAQNSSNWNNPANWSLQSGGPGGASVPGIGEQAFFDGNGLGNCHLDGDVNIWSIQMVDYTSTIQLNGYFLRISGAGNNVFEDGMVDDASASSEMLIDFEGISRFTGTIFNVILNVTSNRLFLDGSTFLKDARFEKKAGGHDTNEGGNVFGGKTILVLSGGGNWTTASTNSDTFLADLQVINNSHTQFSFSQSNRGNLITGDLEIQNNNRGQIYIAKSSRSYLQITGNVKALHQGEAGNIYLASEGDLNIGGNLEASLTSSESAQIIMANSISSSISVGRETRLQNTGRGNRAQIILGKKGDASLNRDLHIINQSRADNSEILLNHDPESRNIYRGNIFIQSLDSLSDGIYFGRQGGSAYLLGQKKISIPGTDSLNFIAGELYFKNFTQTGTDSLSLVLAAQTSRIFMENCDWRGKVKIQARRMYIKNSNFRQVTTLNKIGYTQSDNNPGGNTFYAHTQLINSSGEEMNFGSQGPDRFLANLDIINEGSSHLRVFQNDTNHVVQGDLLIINNPQSTNNSNDIVVGTHENNVLKIGGSVQIFNRGAAQRSQVFFPNKGRIELDGDLDIQNEGSSRVANVVLSNAVTSNLNINRGNLNILNDGTIGDSKKVVVGGNGAVNINGKLAALNQASLNDASIYLANQANSSVSIQDTARFENQGQGNSSRIWLGKKGDVTFHSTLDLINASQATNAQIYLNHNAESQNNYQGDVRIQSTHIASDGIHFGRGGGSGTLAAGASLYIPGEDSLNFIGGELYLRNLRQLGNQGLSLDLGNTASVVFIYDSEWQGPVNIQSPRINSQGSTFHHTAQFVKKGTGNDHWRGGNVFESRVTVINRSASRIRMANNLADIYHSDVVFEENGTGDLQPAFNQAHEFKGQLTLNGNEIYLGQGNAVIRLNGNQGQQLGGTSPLVRIKNLELLNTSTAGLSLLSPLSIRENITFVDGILHNDAGTLVQIDNNATALGANDNSFVEGPVRKVGNNAFVFPIGKNQNYRPIAISAPSRTNHHFTAEYFPQSPDLASPTAFTSTLLDPSLNHVSSCEYWILDRTNGNSEVYVTLYWDENSCDFDHQADLKVARWNDQRWKDHGGSQITGDLNSGTLTTSAPVSEFSPFTLGVMALGNPLPIELMYFQAKAEGKKVLLDWETQLEINNDFYTLERSKDGQNWEVLHILKAAPDGQVRNKYSHIDLNPYVGWSYYRLKQTDRDGSFTYSEIRSVQIEETSVAQNLKIYPNPTVDFVEIEGAGEEMDFWQIFDAQGKDIKNLVQMDGQDAQKLRLDLRSLAQGTYILKTKTQVHKILKK